MSKALDKYNGVRSEINNGDVILFRGTSMLSKTIQYCDKAYYNHAGLVMRLGSRLLILDSNAHGVRPDFLSMRMDEYIDFCVVRINNGLSQMMIDSCVNRVIDRSESSLIKYDFALLPRVAIARKFGYDIKNLGEKENRDICSMFTGERYLIQSAGIKCLAKAKEKQNWLTPEDHLRFLDTSELKALFDDRKVS